MQNQIKNHIKEFRIRNGYTQSQLGTIIGVSKNSISMYETGGFEPSLGIICRLCDIFNCSFEELFEYKHVFSMEPKIVIRDSSDIDKAGDIYEKVFTGPYL